MLTLGGRNPTYGTMMALDIWGIVVNEMICKILVWIGEGVSGRRGVDFGVLPLTERSVLTTVLALPCST